MHFKINEVDISLENNQLSINLQATEVNQKTHDAMLFLLESKNEVVEKNALVSKIWQDVVVSDDSLFKQIQLVRKILVKAGLPDDTIENIYGKGYRVKYPIEVSDKVHRKGAESTDYSKFPIYVFFLPLIVIVLVAVSWWLFKQVSHDDLLNEDEKESIHNLMVQDWNEGLINIEQILANTNQKLSQSDLAYLYSKKGVAQLRLQKYQDSFESLNQALILNLELNDFDMIGNNHLNLAKYYDSTEKRLKQIDHIEKAISYFQQTGSATSVIDAQMELAYLQKKSGDIKLSIKTYSDIIDEARNISDKTGEMIATNNLAATHLIINENDKALELAEQGLALNLEIGNGQHIANSYSFLSQLYQEKLQTSKALTMIEQALKYQLSSGDFRNMSPKLMTLNDLLVQTFQYTKAGELLSITEQYAKALKIKNGVATLNLYSGMNAAHQGLWPKAEEDLVRAYQLSEKNNFKYKQNQTIAYLALAHYFNDNHLQALEPALKVAKNEKSNERSKALAALVLAYSYRHIERQQLFDEWFTKAKNNIQPDWLFEYQLLLELKLQFDRSNDSSAPEQEISNIKSEVQSVQAAKLELASKSQMNEKIYTELITKVLEHINGMNHEFHPQ